MKNKIYIVLFLVLLMSSSLFTNAKQPYINDDANLLTKSEISSLEEMAATYSSKAGTGIYVLTHNNKKAVDGEIYIENFYDDVLFDIQPSSVILLIDMANRDVVIEGYKKAEIYIHSFRGDDIISKISPKLTNNDFYGAISTFINMSYEYLLDDSDLNYDHNYSYNNISSTKPNPLIDRLFFNIIVSFIIALVIILIMLSSSSGKVTVNNLSYLDLSKKGLIGRRDTYITTSVTKVKKPESSSGSSSSSRSSSSGHRGGVSRGGRSHSTSRGKF